MSEEISENSVEVRSKRRLSAMGPQTKEQQGEQSMETALIWTGAVVMMAMAVLEPTDGREAEA